MKIIIYLILFVLTFIPLVNSAEIYYWVDEKGIKHYEAGLPSQEEREEEHSKLSELSEHYYNIGVRFYNDGSYVQAVEYFYKVSGLLPNWAENRYNLGLSYLAIGDIQNSYFEYQMLTKLNSELANDLHNRISVINSELKAKQLQEETEKQLKDSEKRTQEAQQKANESLKRAEEAERKAKFAEMKARQAEIDAQRVKTNAHINWINNGMKGPPP